MSRVKESPSVSGYFQKSGLPYDRFGHGPKPLVAFQGLMFENKPGVFTGMAKSMYGFLMEEYTIYIVLRKPNLPHGYTLKDMADDYAQMIRDEFSGPVDVIGLSTGGSILLHFLADHPHLARKAIIHSSAHTLRKEAKALQLRVAEMAKAGRYSKAYFLLLGFMQPKKGLMRFLVAPFLWVGSLMIGMFDRPKDPSDLVVTVLAEDKHAFRDDLHRIPTPVLVIAGSQDPFYSEELFTQTAEGIPHGRLILYPKMGHPAQGKSFQRDVFSFLSEV